MHEFNNHVTKMRPKPPSKPVMRRVERVPEWVPLFRESTTKRMTSDLPKREGGMKSNQKILRLREVCERLGVSKSTVYNWLDVQSRYYRADFPRPVRIGLASIGFVEHEIDAFIEEIAATCRA